MKNTPPHVLSKTRTAESGRSMVEMLGTLAIIGVLSIGGIMGYSYGMDKYHANQTINDVNLRAVDLISQLSQGHTPNLDSWATISTAGYPISLNSDEAPTNYYIKVEKVPFDVCDMIAQNMPDTVKILVDNATQACANGENVMDFTYAGFEMTNGGENDEEKCGDTVCGECQKCYLPAQICTEVEDFEKRCKMEDDKLGWCVRGSCYLIEDSCDCTTDQYCADQNKWACNPQPSTNCVNLNFSEYTIKGKTYYISNSAMSWWDNVSACEALSKKIGKNISMISVQELVTNQDGSQWISETGNEKRTILAEQLYTQSTKSSVWTRDWIRECEGYAVRLSTGMLLNNYLKYSGFFAVCR
ncbi:MAG: hypothetical protein IKL32_01090 [Alphaproteobacteria bacterium]|nr:hypothetical protein [Alphaproteobacteria bacterium]